MPSTSTTARSSVTSLSRGRSDGGCDGDAPARLLHERHVHVHLLDLQHLADLVADLHCERLAEHSLLAEAAEINLQRLRLEAPLARSVLDRRLVEVGLIRD